MLTQMLAVELGPEGIRAERGLPGRHRAGHALDARRLRRARRPDGGLADPPLGRVGRAEDVAAAVVFLVSQDAAFVNGATLLIDGGMRAGLDAWSVAP